MLTIYSTAFSKRKVTICFEKKTVVVENQDLVKNHTQEAKVFLFRDLVDVSKQEISVHTEDTNAPWRYKITVAFENQTEFDIYARTIDERSYWILMFCRILDF